MDSLIEEAKQYLSGQVPLDLVLFLFVLKQCKQAIKQPINLTSE